MKITTSDPSMTFFLSNLVGEEDRTEFLLDWVWDRTSGDSLEERLYRHIKSGLEEHFEGDLEVLDWSAYGEFQIEVTLYLDILPRLTEVKDTIVTLSKQFAKEYKLKELCKLYDKLDDRNTPEAYQHIVSYEKSRQYQRVIEILADRIIRNTPVYTQ